MSSPIRDNAVTVCSLDQLFQEVNTIGTLWEKRWSPIQMRFWFRGVDDHKYSLNPGLLRPPYINKDLENLEFSISNDFKLRGRPHFPIFPLTVWEQIFLMQHYGFPTRLLDWTESLSVAAYFGVRNINSESDGAIWILSPQWLVHKAKGEYATHLYSGHEWLEPYKMRECGTDLIKFNKLVPLPIIPEHFDNRIIVQRGRFTIHTFQPDSIEDFGNEDFEKYGKAGFLQQIKIKSCGKAGMRQFVRIFGGATEDILFPDLDGLSRSMRWEALEMAIKKAKNRP